MVEKTLNEPRESRLIPATVSQDTKNERVYYTAVLRKVVPQKPISVRDNVERYYGYWSLTVS